MRTETDYRVKRDGQDLGTISVAEGGVVTLKLKTPAQLEAAEILKRLQKEGVSDLGEIVLKEPIKIAPDLVFIELWRELALRGYKITPPPKTSSSS
jgi:hypothetical protein